MIKRTPQEIADFFDCYVVQSGEEEQSWLISREKPTRREHAWVYTWNIDVFVIGKEFFRAPEDHDWTKLYEPRNVEQEDKQAIKTSDEATHISEVYSHKEYILISENNPSELMKIVTENLNNGWELYGSPFSEASADSREWYHYQAMVRGV